jgi:hypothetical protein
MCVCAHTRVSVRACVRGGCVVWVDGCLSRAQAPGLYKGYDADALPAVVQAIRDGDPGLTQSQIDVAADRVQAAADYLSKKEQQQQQPPPQTKKM